MFSILYVSDDDVYQIGPFPTEEEAMAAAKKAACYTEEFDIQTQHVYIFKPDHSMRGLYSADVGL